MPFVGTSLYDSTGFSLTSIWQDFPEDQHAQLPILEEGLSIHHQPKAGC
jgi:hypothetical protein